MASNGLVANPQKTTLMFLNLENKGRDEISVKIGKEVITQSAQAKLIGMTIK